MRRSNRVKWSELWVGMVVVFAFTLIMWASFTGGGTSIFEGKKTFVAYFSNVNGLTPGSPVWLQGVEVGNVRTIKFDDVTRKIRIEGKVANNAWHLVRADSEAKIGAIGLIGDKYVQLYPGSSSAPQLESGGEVKAVEDDADKIFREGATAVENMNKLFDDLAGIVTKLNRGEGTLGRLMTDDDIYDNLNTTLSELSATLKTFNENQDRAFASLEEGVESFSELTSAMTDSSGTMGRLLYDTTLYTNLSSMSESLARIVSKIDNGEGTFGAMMQDDGVYQKTRDLLARLENLLLDMETNPKKYFKVSVF